MLVDLTVEAGLTKNLTKPASAPTMTPDEEHDLALVRRLAAGDRAALSELYAAYGQRLFAYAVRLTGDPAQAEDVLQDALLVVWKSAGRFRGEGRIVAWLLGIVHHMALKSLRHPSTPLSDEMEASLPAEIDLPEETLLGDERSAWLRTGLRELPLEQRAALELVFYQQLSLKEVAEVCGCPVGTVKSRLSQARKNLRGILRRLETEVTV